MAAALSNDELGLILNRLNSHDRKSCSLVCKKWLVVEGMSRSSIHVRKLNLLPRLLSRYPNLVTFRTRTFVNNVKDAHLALIANYCPKLEVIELFETEEVGSQGLRALALGCPKLSKVVLGLRDNVEQDGIVWLVTLGHNLKHLELNMSTFGCVETLRAIGSSSCCLIRVLKLGMCELITDSGLSFLTTGSCSKTIKILDLHRCNGITNLGVSLLHKMYVLEDLNLADCSRVTVVGSMSISAIRTLKKLNMSLETFSEPVVNDDVMQAIAKNCLNLEMLYLQRNPFVTRIGIHAFLDHKCLQYLDVSQNHIGVYLSHSDVEDLALKCPALMCLEIDIPLGKRLFRETQGTLSKFRWTYDEYHDPLTD